MREHLKTEWRQFLASPPGARFLQCYERHQKRNAPWLKPLMFFAGVFSFVIGFVLAFIPGPAILFFAISAALFACEYKPVANAFDKVEVWGRGLWAKFRGRGRGRGSRKQSRMETTAGTLSDEERETLRAAAEASIQQRLAATTQSAAAAQPGATMQPAAAAPGPVDMRNLEVPGAPPASGAIEFKRPASAPAEAAPVDMSNLRIPLNGTREIHAQAVAQASVEKYRASAEPQPGAAEPVDAYLENEAAAPSQAGQPQAAATPPSQWSVDAAVPPRRAADRGAEPLFSTQRDQAPHFASTKQGTGPDQPRVVAIVPHVSRPPMQRAGTMRIWAEVTKPSPAPAAVQNVKRVIQQSAKNNASVVMLAPPAMIGDRATRQRQRAAGHS